jgi:hypothetical protein
MKIHAKNKFNHLINKAIMGLLNLFLACQHLNSGMNLHCGYCGVASCFFVNKTPTTVTNTTVTTMRDYHGNHNS